MIRKTFFEGRPVLIMEGTRIPTEDRESGKFYYELRSGDHFDRPYTIEKSVVTNFWGTLISDHMLLSKRFPCVNLNAYYRRSFRFSGTEYCDTETINTLLHSPITR
ncbi:LPD28 domain-containing protein [Paenibacillus alvei]|uniref:LPD28 domain-containing protein n=1 Tax=Paenibacillus alvei TaxID=44250 RepID=UPI0036F2AD5F